MTKQEEIREHLIELFEQTSKDEPPDRLADATLWVLDADDAVIKVDRELPKDWYNDCEDKFRIKEYLKEAGYEATEPLIKEEKK